MRHVAQTSFSVISANFGCGWQRCRFHFARNLLVKVPKASQDMVAAALRSVFVWQEAAAVEAQWEQVIGMLTEKFPAAALMD